MTAARPELLDGRYLLRTRIATGGVGEVWRAEDIGTGRLVAVKTLRADQRDDAARASFQAEAWHAAVLTHPGIASVYDHGEYDSPAGRPAWLVMELVEGEVLSDRLRGGPLALAEALDVVGQTALALAAAHAAGVVHRDVKPGNLMLRSDGIVKVTDFGIALGVDAAQSSPSRTVVGTAYYLSPEQALDRPVGPASDVYSLGVVAHECLTGERPFGGPDAAAVADAHLHQPPPPLPGSIPAPVRALVGAVLTKDPARRPADAGELGRTALALRAALLAGHDLSTVPPLSEPRPAPPTDRPGGRPTRLRLHAPSLPQRGRDGQRPAGGSAGQRHRRGLGLAAGSLGVVGLALGARAFLGPTEPPVPDLAAASVDEAQERVREVGLEPVQRTETSRTVPAGRLLRTEPSAGARLPDGGRVVLVVSAGPPAAAVDATRLVGQPYESVRDTLRAEGLDPTPTYDGTGSPPGTVSAVEPTGRVPAGSRIVVHVVP